MGIDIKEERERESAVIIFISNNYGSGLAPLFFKLKG